MEFRVDAKLQIISHLIGDPRATGWSDQRVHDRVVTLIYYHKQAMDADD